MAKDDIAGIKKKQTNTTFYGNKTPPHNDKGLQENSDPTKNEDLYGYYEIYTSAKESEMVEGIKNSGLKELSPAQVLFLLEFQMVESTNADGSKVVSLQYVPHRFYHRYARSESSSDKEMSTKEFTKILETKHLESAYFNHIESGKVRYKFLLYLLTFFL